MAGPSPARRRVKYDTFRSGSFCFVRVLSDTSSSSITSYLTSAQTLTLNIAKSGGGGLRKNLKHDLCPGLLVLSSIKQLTQSSLQLAFVNPACLAAFPLKRGGIINTRLEDIPAAKGNILALSLNQQWGETGLTAGQSEPPDGN